MLLNLDCIFLSASNTLQREYFRLAEVRVGKNGVPDVKPLQGAKGCVPFWSGGVSLVYGAHTALSCL